MGNLPPLRRFAPVTLAGRRPRHVQPAVDGVMVAATATSPLAVLGSHTLPAYWRFQRAVAAAQLKAWLPARGRLLVDISGPQARGAIQAAASGYAVVRVLPRLPAPAASSGPRPAEAARAGAMRDGAPLASTARRDGARAGRAQGGALRARVALAAGYPGPGRIATVVADSASLGFLADGCADGVIADDGTLSRHLMAEDVAAEITRVLRPGGQLLACVDSLVLGMSILAEQHHWAQLTDLPHAEVVLIPWPDGTITRCFGPQQLGDLLTEAGLEVGWIRPRTVLSPSMVDHILRKDPGAIARLVRAEIDAGADESSSGGGAESFGIYLLAAARKPGPARSAEGR